eukprot:Seg2132.6 transcript_id=Seg2132.6/GoldUCD/mRNA.D3Y31 product=Cofilin protein_id=Seg2132.6/GoldUCD/D3Y31
MVLDAGCSTDPSCLVAFEGYKMRKESDFVIFRLNPQLTEVVVDVSPPLGGSEQVWKEIGSKSPVVREDEPVEYWNMRRLMLEAKQPRYGVILVNSKLVMIYWSPDDAQSKQKMVYTSTKHGFKAKLTGIQSMLECNDMEELSYGEVFKRCSKQP